MQAVAFLDFFKAGIALTVGRGHGFILRKLDGGCAGTSTLPGGGSDVGCHMHAGVSHVAASCRCGRVRAGCLAPMRKRGGKG